MDVVSSENFQPGLREALTLVPTEEGGSVNQMLVMSY